MGSLKLQKAPTFDAEISFLSALVEPKFTFGDSNYFTFEQMQEIAVNVPAYYKNRADTSLNCTLPNGDIVPRVQQTEYWLVENDDTFIGQIALRDFNLPPYLLEFGGHIGYSIRPSMMGQGYATKMLKLMLNKLNKTEYPYVLITCNEKNKASCKVIEKNGGILQDIINSKYSPENKTCRYHIKL